MTWRKPRETEAPTGAPLLLSPGGETGPSGRLDASVHGQQGDNGMDGIHNPLQRGDEKGIQAQAAIHGRDEGHA